MTPQSKKNITFILRWGIAAIGITWVLAKTSFHDRVIKLRVDPISNEVQSVRLEPLKGDAGENDLLYVNTNGKVIPRTTIWTPADRETCEVRQPDGTVRTMSVV